MVFPVALDVSQHAAWHRDNSPPALLHRAWEREAASWLQFILGYFLCQTVLRDDTVCEKTQEDAHVARETDMFPQHLFIPLTIYAV